MRILTVVDYDEMWPTLFENERTLLQMTLGKVISRIHHIGSTSVPGLSAKPVIDILIEVANLEGLDSLNQAMEGVGYTVRGENGILNRRYFTKGGNQRSHHIHAFTTGDAQIIKHLAFRDYLIKHNDVAIQYALMKKSAMLLCENDSHRYSIYKADFIQKHLRMALIDAGHSHVNHTVAGHNIDFNIGIAIHKSGHDRRKQKICRFNGCIDADTSGRGIAIPVKRFKRAFYGVERLKNRLNQFLTSCRRGDALGRAIKQANSEPGFQSLQGMTQR